MPEPPSTTPAPGRTRATLRAATHAVHVRLHRHPALAGVMSGTIGLASYRRLLIRLYGFHKPLEDAILAAPARWHRALALDRRRRVYRLESDLAHLGVRIARLPYASPPATGTDSQLLGTLYVREGAMLGGGVMARKLDALFHDTPDGRRFLAGTTEDTQLWYHFCDVLERVGKGADVAEICAAAAGTFAALEAWLTEPAWLTGETA